MVQRVPTYLWPFGSVAMIYIIMETTEAADRAKEYVHRF